MCGAIASYAQNFPTRPLRIVVPYAAGGSTDVLARMVGQKLTAVLGQPVVIDNRTGAGTIIATEIVARAAPDGYTLLMATPPLTIAAALYEKLPFDTARDFAAVTNIAATSNVLVVHPAVPAQSVKELIALAKANPGKFTFGSSGVGGASHLAVELFRSMAGIELLHVQRVAEAHGGGGLALARGGRADGGHQDELAVFLLGQAVDVFERHLGLVMTIRHEMLFGDAQLLGNLGDALHLRGLRDFDIG